MGAIVLRTVVYLSQIVAGLAMTLEKNPQLLAQLRLDRPQDAFERTSLVEDAANVVREGFIKCLSDRGGAAGPKGKPEGKRAGIYLMANHCLKLLHKVSPSFIFLTNCILTAYSVENLEVPTQFLKVSLLSHPHSNIIPQRIESPISTTLAVTCLQTTVSTLLETRCKRRTTSAMCNV